MSENLTTRELFDEARDIRPTLEKLIALYDEATHRHRIAKNDWQEAERMVKRAEAQAFTKAKGEKATDALAERLARLNPEVQELEEIAAEKRREMDAADADAEAARVASSRYQNLLDNYTGISHALNRELKAFMSVGGDGYR